MHDSRKVFLLEKEPRCILAVYEPGDHITPEQFKTWDENIAVGDFVTVQSDTRHGMTVVKVTDVDVEPIIDSDKKMMWAFAVVRHDILEGLLVDESQFLNAARSAEKARRKAQLKQDFIADVSGEFGNVTAQIEST